MAYSMISRFLKLESLNGIILFIMAFAALIVCNSPLADLYHQLWDVVLSIKIGGFLLSHSILFWVNDGLMTLFFLLVGLELKREFLEGELKDVSSIVLPAAAAVGGMLVPALLYCIINAHDLQRLQGWAIPVATDIAFALGVLSLFGRRAPIELRLFLLALAIFDDVGAIVIIAIFHTHNLSYWSLGVASLLVSLLLLFNVKEVSSLSVYLVVGILLWLCVLNSGIHATISGVLLSIFIPLKTNKKPGVAPARRLEFALHPWVAFLIMPLFAFANAGVSLKGLTTAALTDTIFLGTVAGLFLGKQLGVLIFSWALIKTGWAKLPEKTSWKALYGVALLCGIGFTMSLFLGTLAFQGFDAVYLAEVRLGVLAGSLLSGVAGVIILRSAFQKHKSLSCL